ncbi:hypothetical protein NC652_009716 [Populus alba x Populus x berolinensis]|nr:hypothetical protein NC652_009716 [Populus alba x Populus x berolinensis]
MSPLVFDLQTCHGQDIIPPGVKSWSGLDSWLEFSKLRLCVPLPNSGTEKSCVRPDMKRPALCVGPRHERRNEINF